MCTLLSEGEAVEVIGANGAVIMTGTLAYHRGNWVGVDACDDAGTHAFLAHWVRRAGLQDDGRHYYGRLD